MGSNGPLSWTYTSTDSKRLRLEHTYVQTGENQVLELVADFERLAQQFPDDLPTRRASLIATAKAVNRLRFQMRDDFEEFTRAWRGFCEEKVAVFATQPGRNVAHMTPRGVVTAISRMHCVGSVSPTVQFHSGPLKGSQIRLYDLVRTCEIIRGDYCCPNASDCPPQIAMIGRQLAYYEEEIVRSYNEARSAVSDVDAACLAKRLQVLTEEHSALRVLLLWSNWRLLGRPTTRRALLSPEAWLYMMRRLELSPEQLAQARISRDDMRERTIESQVARGCLEDIVNEMLDAPRPGMGQSLSLLSVFDAVAAAGKAEIAVELLHARSVCAFMQGVLSPWQKSLVASLTHSLMRSERGGAGASFADLGRFFYDALMDDEMSGWLDGSPYAYEA